MRQLVLGKRQLHDVLGQHVDKGVDTAGFRIPAQKVERQRPAEVKVQGPQDLGLHLLDVGLGEGLVGDVDVVAHVGRVHLLVLGGDEHRGHPDQLELLSADRTKRVLKEFQLLMNVNNFDNKDLPGGTCPRHQR